MIRNLTPFSLFFLTLSVFIRAAGAHCKPPRHQRCRSFVVAIVLGVVLGFFLCLLILSSLFCILRRRRPRNLGLATQVEVDTEAMKDLGKDEDRTSQSGNAGTVNSVGENTRLIHLAAGRDSGAACSPKDKENAAVHFAVPKCANILFNTPAKCKEIEREISKRPSEIKSDPSSSIASVFIPSSSSPPNSVTQAQPSSQPDSPSPAQIQHCDDLFINPVETRPFRGNSVVGGLSPQLAQADNVDGENNSPHIASSLPRPVCRESISGVDDFPRQKGQVLCADDTHSQELTDKPQQTDIQTESSTVECEDLLRKVSFLPLLHADVDSVLSTDTSRFCPASSVHPPSGGSFIRDGSEIASEGREAMFCPPAAIGICEEAIDSIGLGCETLQYSSDERDDLSESLTQTQSAIAAEAGSFMRPFVAFESEAVSVDPPVPTLVTPAEFHSNIDTYVSTLGLEMFYTTNMNTRHTSNLSLASPRTSHAGPAYLHAIARNAASLRSDPTTSLGNPQNIHRLTRLSLYHPVIYCDDSSSMSGNPFEIQRQLVSRIANVATKIVPSGYGLDLYFINNGSFHNVSAIGMEYALRNVAPCGCTPIGTNLRAKVLKPLVYDAISSGRGLERPLLVCIITDGCPTEAEDTFKEAIVECRRYIQGAGYNSTAVRFSISQIGMDIQATRFLDVLRSDREIEDIIRVTTDGVDQKYEELRRNERELDTWLLKVLTNPIMENGKF